jgi:hypothetical protein
VQGVHDLAVDVELQLAMRRVADADGPRVLVSRQPVNLPFCEAPLARDAVHDLGLLRTPRRGAQEPVPPGPRFAVVAGVHQGEERKGGISQPAKAIVPVACSTKLLRQRGGGRGDKSSCRSMRQRFQGDQ